jgi:hypothetical protein
MAVGEGDSNPDNLSAMPVFKTGAINHFGHNQFAERCVHAAFTKCEGPHCGGRLRVIAIVQDPLAVQAILTHFGRSLSTEATRASPARPGREQPRLAARPALKASFSPGPTGPAAASLRLLVDPADAAEQDARASAGDCAVRAHLRVPEAPRPRGRRRGSRSRLAGRTPATPGAGDNLALIVPMRTRRGVR